MSCCRLVLAIFLATICASAGELDSLFVRLKKTYKSEIALEASYALVQNCRPDGTWNGVEYHRKGDVPVDHLKKIREAAEGFENSCGKSGLSEKCGTIKSAVLRSLQYWFSRQKDFVSDNWWINEIGIQREFAPIAFLMWNEFSRSLQKQIASQFPEKPSRNGTNRTWISELVVVRGILERRDSLVREGLRNIESTMLVTNQEGHQKDHSYFMHGNLLYNGGYGKMALSIASRWAAICRGTVYAFSKESLDVMSSLALEGNRWMMWKGMVDPMTLGREISRKDGNKVAAGFRPIIDNLMVVDSSHTNEYLSWQKELGGENVLSGCRYFDRGEIMVCRSNDYYISLKMSSKNTVGSECINQENRKGFWLGAGVLSVYRHYDDFKDIYPLWDWSMLPGVTSYDVSEQKEKRVTNGSEFVKGLSDGPYGIASMDLNRSGISAKKAWFFLDGKVVSLGNGIRYDGGKNVVTTVDQRLVHSDVLLGMNPVKENDSVWGQKLWHDDISYIDLDQGGFFATYGIQKGNWKDIGTLREDAQGKVLRIWKSHGTNPNSASYAYQINVGVSRQEFTRKSRKAVVVVRNDSSAQVIFDETEKILAGAVYVSPEFLFDDIGTTPKPPFLFLKKNGVVQFKELN